MKTIIYITIIAITTLLAGNSIFGQERNLVREKEEKDFQVLQEKINQAVSLSKAAGELRIKLSTESISILGSRTVAIEAVKSGDATLMPLIEIYAELGWYHADTALAKSGRTEYLTKILSQTDKSKNIWIRYEAVKKLILIGNKIAYKRLLELLDDTSVPLESSGDAQFVPIAEFVIHKLSEVVANPPNQKDIYDTDKVILIWKKWFEEHKELTEGSETPKCDVVTPTPKPMVSKTDNSFVNDILLTDYLSIVLLNKLF
jgi:hypothetical protein